MAARLQTVAVGQQPDCQIDAGPPLGHVILQICVELFVSQVYFTGQTNQQDIDVERSSANVRASLTSRKSMPRAALADRRRAILAASSARAWSKSASLP